MDYYAIQPDSTAVRRIAACLTMFILTAILSLTVFAADKKDGKNETNSNSFDNFKQQTGSKTSFTDIAEDDWFAEDVKEACSYGLISGVTETEFSPDATMDAASSIAIAAKLHHMYSTGRELDLTSEPWYKDYVKYAVDKKIITGWNRSYGALVTRAQFIGILSGALPDDAMAQINPVEDNSIPDVPPNSQYYDEIYKMYRAGIVTGSGDAHWANPSDYVPRAEAAAVLLRMADPSRRQKVRMTEDITIYNAEGSSRIIKALDYGDYVTHGWDVFTTTADSPDSENNVIPRNSRLSWLSVDWYDYPVTTVYAPDGRSSVIPMSEKSAWLDVGWYDYPVIAVYALDGRSCVIPEKDKEAWLAVDWYESPATTVYAPDGRIQVIPENDKEEWLASGWYGSKFIPLPDAVRSKNYTTTDIPVLSIGTDGSAIPSTGEYLPCEVNTFNVEEDHALFGAKGGIRVRGNASRPSDPPPYRIKLDTKQNLFGLNDGAKAKSWVLLNYPSGARDNVKNAAAFRIGRKLLGEDGNYCSDATFVHLYINEGFCGVYLLCEQTQAQKHRVDVNEPKDGYTGTDVGYLVEIDNYSEPPYFREDYENAFVSDITGKSRKLRGAAYAIKSDTYSQEQQDFIAKYIRGVFRIVYEACERNNYLTFDENYDLVDSEFTDPEQTIDAVADIRSFVDTYILYEIMDDNDVGEGSFFMCVDFSEESTHPKLTFTAPWDFNWSCMSTPTGSLYACTFCTDNFMASFGDRSNPWFIILYKQWWFRELVSKRWTEISGSKGIGDCVDAETRILDRFSDDINRKNAGTTSGGRYYLNWIRQRSEWLDTLWLK